MVKTSKNKKLWNIANKIIPTGNSFLSKNPSRFLVSNWPTYYSKAKGCYIWDLNNKKYIDFSYMGVGTNIMGYSNEFINRAVIQSIKKSTMSTLNSPDEVYFAKKLLDIHPLASQAKFAKTGAEANAIAIRISRTFNKKNKIIICGYHGWHDWYLSAKMRKKNFMDTHLFSNLKIGGVPKALKNLTFSFKYNDFEGLKKIIKKNKDVSAVIMEVQRDTEPKNNFLRNVRRICSKNNICLIFDECTTGFREQYGGLHLKYKVNPDIAMFGKAIGNGASITSIIGRKKVMKYAKDSFISSTFWSDRTGFASGIATLDLMKKKKSWIAIKKKGRQIKLLLKKEAEKNNINIKFKGMDSLIKFDLFNVKKNYKKIVISEMLKKGFIANDNIYVSLAHSEKLIKKYISAISNVFAKIRIR